PTSGPPTSLYIHQLGWPRSSGLCRSEALRPRADPTTPHPSSQRLAPGRRPLQPFVGLADVEAPTFRPKGQVFQARRGARLPNGSGDNLRPFADQGAASSAGTTAAAVQSRAKRATAAAATTSPDGGPTGSSPS